MIHDAWVLRDAVEDQPSIPVAHQVLRSILIRRGVSDLEAFRRFTAPTLADLHDGSAIHGMDHACERIGRAVRDGESILIYGDYDVDGVTSIVMLQTVLRAMGAEVGFVVPHRLVDGYGLKMEVIERVLTERDVKLVITVDCGITSVEPVERAVERGIDVIITDHHLPPESLPTAAAVLNPKQPGCLYPFKELAGVGVAFKLCCELIRRNRLRISVESLLKIAAIGTVADVAPLVGENRTITSLGLHGLADVRNPGLRALLQRLGLGGKPLRAVDVGFKIGPRINAAGRLASADTAIRLFAATDETQGWEIAAELDRLNVERQKIEQEVRTSAESQIAGDERIFVLAGEGWHRGVLGLTAGRLVQRHHRPALVMTIEGSSSVGSARGIASIDLHGELSRVADLFTHFGGHELACGFSLSTGRLGELKERLHSRFAQLDESLFKRTAPVDGLVTLRDLDGEFLAAHEMLQPFGNANPLPLFEVRNIRVTGCRPFGEECREYAVSDGTATANAVLWPGLKVLAEPLEGGLVDVLVQLETGRRGEPRLTIADVRTAGEPEGPERNRPSV